jgi:hypothetical protein
MVIHKEPVELHETQRENVFYTASFGEHLCILFRGIQLERLESNPCKACFFLYHDTPSTNYSQN